MTLFSSGLIWILVFAALILIIFRFFRRISENLVTSQFKAAEAISDDRFPADWLTGIERDAARNRAFPFTNKSHDELFFLDVKLDRLTKLFATGPFFEDEETRDDLLKKIDQFRSDWTALSWPEIKDRYSAPPKGDTPT